MGIKHALVVDDEPNITLLVERILKQQGFSVLAFTDPRAALEHLRSNRVGLLVVDIRMPVLSGFDLINAAKSWQPEMAVLVMTGFGTVETAIQALQQGVDGLLLKPFERAELLNAVTQTLNDNQKKRDTARIQAMRPLFDITEALLAETRLDRLPGLILNAIRGYLNCAHAGLYEISEEGKLVFIAGRGKKLPEETPSHAQGILGRAFNQGKPLLLNLTELTGEESLLSQMREHAFETLLCIPTSLVNIRSVFFAGRGIGEPPFREVDLEMFTILARQSTVALENARLYEKVWAYVRRVEESQQALVQAEKLATAGRMTASIAHEVNNPLQSVRNCLHLASREDLPEESRKNYLELAQSELDRLSGVVQRMLDFYRPAEECQEVDLAQLVNQTLALLGQQLADSDIRVTVKVGNLPNVSVVGAQIQQVFINLILNAIDAMPQGGELKISLKRTKKHTELLFRDTGAGVPSELRSAIFEPFSSTKDSGMGLGLSVSYGIISNHNGSLEIVDKAGQVGACFRIRLPIKENI